MLQKYFPILEEINSPFAALIALDFAAESAKIAVNGISNEVLEALLKEAVSSTATYKKEVEVSVSELEAARKAASKTVRYCRYRAAQAARSARVASKNARRIKAMRRPIAKASLRGLSGLSLEVCRAKAVAEQTVVRAATNSFNTAHEAVCATLQGGDIRSIRSAVATLKVAVRELEVAHLNFKFAREMLTISLARHSA